MILAYPGMAFAEEQGSVDVSANGGEAVSEQAAAESGTVVSEEISDKTDAAADEGSGSEEITSEEAAPSDDQSGKTEVTVVQSAEELAQNTSAADNEAFFTIDASKKKTSEEFATEEIESDVSDILSDSSKAAKKQDKIIDALEDSGFYAAEEGKGSKVEVTSMFAAQRLRLTAEKADALDAYGAVNAVYFKDYYLLSYDSVEATKLAYESLCSDYGEENVLADIPVKADEYGWGTQYMGMTIEKDIAAGGADVTIAVCDTGIKSTHGIFSDTSIVDGYNVLATSGSEYKEHAVSNVTYVNYPDPQNFGDDNGHGTHVAGIIAESTPSNVKIMPVKVLDSKGEGYMEDVFIGVAYAEEKGADVINLSLGGKESNDWAERHKNTYEPMLAGYKALVVCAAGNGDGNGVAYNMDLDGVNILPAELDNLVCVGAFDGNGDICSFSNYGDAVDYAAPGQGITVAGINSNNSYGSGSGTSFACPYISAAAGLIKAENPGFDKGDIEAALDTYSYDMGDKYRDDYFGKGCPVFTNGSVIVNGGDISNLKGITITPKKTVSPVYTGSELKLDPVVKHYHVTLKEHEDYEVSYTGNINVGTATMTITGKGRYTGSVPVDFTINPKNISSLVSLSQNTFSYTGNPANPVVNVSRYGGRTLEEGKDYAISYPEGRVNPGTYYVRVTGKGNFNGTATLGFSVSVPAPTIVPAGARFSKLQKGKGSVKFKWKKQKTKTGGSYITGYQVQVSADPSFASGVKTSSVKGYKKTSRKISKLMRKTRYYGRMRTYIVLGGQTYYSGWSAVKSVKTK